MGISHSALTLLCKTISSNGLMPSENASLLTLGRQSILVDRRSCEKILARYGFTLPHPKGLYLDTDLDTLLFRSVGFKLIDSLDCSDYESPTILHDLNIPIAHKEMAEYNLIFDGGTSEHIFNIPEFLKTVYKLCRVNGLVIHSVPINNWPDHGFYQFSPTLLTDFYNANKWRIVDNYVVRAKYEHSRRWEVFPYTNGAVDYITAGGGGGDPYSQWLVVQKLQGSSGVIFPKQSRYLKVWNPNIEGPTKKDNFFEIFTSRVKAWLKRYPQTRSSVMFFYVRLILRHRKPRRERV